MKKNTLYKDTITGIGWSAVERFSVQGVNFIVQIFLARLLVPDDYGVIGMLAIFLQIAQVFIDSGFANALIQKQKCTNDDYCTVFLFNIVLSVCIYFIFFLLAPTISMFYKLDILTRVMRVISITLILNAIPIVHKTILVKKVDFRKQSFVSLLSAVVSGTIGIIMAIKGFGVWALCFQQIVNSVVQMILYCFIVEWHPSFTFSRKSFNSLFSFGSKLLVSSLINSVYRNLYSLVIGKTYSATDLGYYSRAEQFAQFPSSNLASIVTRVAYPILSKIQDDNEILKQTYRKLIKYSSILIFPLMFGLIAIAKPLTIVLLTEKWLVAASLLQILCLDLMLDHITCLNLNLLYVKGRSDIALKLEIIKKSIAVIILFASIPLGLKWMCWGRVLYSIIATFLNTIYTRKLIDLNLWHQIQDFGPSMIIGALMSAILIISNEFINRDFVQILFDILLGIIFYLSIILLIYKQDYKEIKTMLYEFTR